MKIFRSIRSFLGREFRFWSLRRIYKRFQNYTMIPEDLYVDNLVLAKRITNTPGCIIECGVWRGGMSAGIAEVLGAGRTYFLFDSFEGLPPAEAIDGEAALEWQRRTDDPGYHDNCTAADTFAMQAMVMAKCHDFHLVKGWFDKTVTGFKSPCPIALLRLDGDWYDSTMVCLESLFDQVVPGGIVILDDYYAWDGCSRALHDFLSRRGSKERIRSFSEICFVIKCAPK